MKSVGSSVKFSKSLGIQSLDKILTVDIFCKLTEVLRDMNFVIPQSADIKETISNEKRR